MSKLYVLPHAGGTAQAYVPLKRALEPRFEVVCHDLPGRGKRARELPLTTIDAVLHELIVNMAPTTDRPWAIFGHSMGALLGHALIHALRRRGRRLPEVLFASGTMAPFARQRKAVAHLPKEEFWREVCQYGGVPDEILQVPEYRDYFEVLLRHDFAVIESYISPAPNPLPIPLVILYGASEMSRQQAASWEKETTRGSEIHCFPGHHFFVFDHIGAIAALIRRTLIRAEDAYRGRGAHE
jgi:surfactin synthase thioesterase subunit